MHWIERTDSLFRAVDFTAEVEHWKVMQGVSLQLAVANRLYRAHFSFLTYHRKHTHPYLGTQNYFLQKLDKFKQRELYGSYFTKFINKQAKEQRNSKVLVIKLHTHILSNGWRLLSKTQCKFTSLQMGWKPPKFFFALTVEIKIQLTSSCKSSVIVALVHDVYQLRMAEEGRWTKVSEADKILFSSFLTSYFYDPLHWSKWESVNLVIALDCSDLQDNGFWLPFDLNSSPHRTTDCWENLIQQSRDSNIDSY